MCFLEGFYQQRFFPNTMVLKKTPTYSYTFSNFKKFSRHLQIVFSQFTVPAEMEKIVEYLFTHFVCTYCSRRTKNE